MFLSGQRWVTRGGEQRARGRFLIVFCAPEKKPGQQWRELRAVTRYVVMHQCGHFMMSRVELDGRTISLSGTYGHDGLPITCDWPELWEKLHPLPDDLVEQFWLGGGHNCAGAEGPAIQAWGKEHPELSKLRREKKTEAVAEAVK